MDEPRSPAEAYAAFRARQSQPESSFERFRLDLDYSLDDFQIEACRALDEGRSVLVAAPTGAGKTVVAHFAVRLAADDDVRVFYTAPIKALSNQKYAELCREYGEGRVGLLTGDLSINRDAQIVVMTTEVLRNMIYSGTDLTTLGFVVLDEVHYLGDRFRGPVWEEVIIHLPAHVALVSLSATVSNAEEFGAWLAEVRGSTDVIVSEHRPVPLHNHVAVGTDLHPLFQAGDSSRTRVNRDLEHAIRPYLGRGSRRDRRRPTHMRFRRPSRTALIHELGRSGLLPGIFFIFSRNGCDDAVEQCLAAGLDLTDRTDKRRIAARLEELEEQLGAEDLSVLGFRSFSTGLLHGFAAHHAGLIPQFKELVEDLFADGTLQVVFATETLALGVNMPARTVVLEKLTKFNGEAHVQITPGEFTQLTGRAGRRGIDVEGHAVVVWHPSIELADIGALASKRTYALQSRFTPTYNMTANLLARMSKADAEKVLETSFAQFQADKGVVGLARRARKADEGIEGYLKAMECDRGDFMEYAQLRRTLSDMEKRAGKARSRNRQRETIESLGALRYGDVVVLPSKSGTGPAVVISPMINREGELRLPTILTEHGKVWHLRMHEVTEPAVALGRLKMPRKFNHRQAKERRALVATLGEALAEGRIASPTDAVTAPTKGPRVMTDEIAAIREQLRAHPCHDCPDREQHARWANRATALIQERDGLARQIEGRTSSIAQVFDRVCAVLTTLRFLPDDSRILRRIYGERDLLVALTVRVGLWDELSEPEAAGLAAALVFQARRPEGTRHGRVPTATLESTLTEVRSTWQNLYAIETDALLPVTPEPDFGLVRPVFRWAEGAGLSAALAGTDIAAGDFVRWAKQTLDLLGQVADVCEPRTALVIRRAAEAIRRGVVAD